MKPGDLVIKNFVVANPRIELILAHHHVVGSTAKCMVIDHRRVYILSYPSASTDKFDLIIECEELTAPST